MSVEVFRESPTGDYVASEISDLSRELTLATGVDVSANVSTETDANGDADPTKDQLRLYCSSAPDGATLDAALAAYPTTAAGVTGTIAVTKGVTIVLFERVLLVGEVILLDAHFFGAVGTVADADPEWADNYGIAWRESAGNVKTTKMSGPAAGTIPGFEIDMTGTATTVQVTATVRKTGTLIIFENNVEVKKAGILPP